ncbi:MAG: hypothetical protein R2991_11115 [Thermoanaerobaculia bacterium]
MDGNSKAPALRLAALFVIAAPAFGAAVDPAMPRFSDRVEVVDELRSVEPVAPGERVEVVFRVGELELVAADVPDVRTEVGVGCDELSAARCERYRGNLRLVARHEDGVVRVSLAGLSRWSLAKLDLKGRVVYPRRAPLALRLGVGVADLSAGGRDVEVSMGVGDLTIRSPRVAVGSVALRTRIGDASLAGAAGGSSGRPFLVGARLEWSEGAGPARIRARLGVGDARVVLE